MLFLLICYLAEASCSSQIINSGLATWYAVLLSISTETECYLHPFYVQPGVNKVRDDAVALPVCNFEGSRRLLTTVMTQRTRASSSLFKLSRQGRVRSILVYCSNDSNTAPWLLDWAAFQFIKQSWLHPQSALRDFYSTLFFPAIWLSGHRLHR